jgi:hypothetical protein
MMLGLLTVLCVWRCGTFLVVVSAQGTAAGAAAVDVLVLTADAFNNT